MRAWGERRRRRSGGGRGTGRLSVILAVTLVVTLGTPSSNVPIFGPVHLSLSGLLSWLTAPSAWAVPPIPPTPKQRTGTAAGLSHQVPAAATRAGGGAGRAPGRGTGELEAYRPHTTPARSFTTGPAAGDGAAGFDAATSRRVADATTATSELYQNADGSYTRKVHAGPVNYQAADGSWQAIDPSLRRGADGRYRSAANRISSDFAPRADAATVASLRFDAAHSIGYGLTGAAPVDATVSGSTVTYPRVLPGTDLQLSSVATGFSEALVLHSADAATSWTFPLQLEGLTAGVAGDGSVEFRDASGRLVGRVPHGSMHDSAFIAGLGGPASSNAVRFQVDSAGGQPVLRMSIDGSWLRDPARVFPVYVDPNYGETGTTDVWYPYTLDDSGSWEMVAGSWNYGGEKGRSFLAFSGLGGQLHGERITSAALHLFDHWASTCTPERFDVAPITQSWSVSGSKSYPGPSLGGSIGNLTANPGAACTNTGEDQTTGTWMTVGLSTATFNSWTTGGADYGLGIYADESSNLTWKRFNSVNAPNSPYLELNYTPDQAPQIDSMYPPTNYNAPTLTPELIAVGHDPDSWPSPVTYNFTVYSSAGATLASSGWIGSSSWAVPAGKLSWSQTYYWSVQAYDGITYSNTTSASYFTTTVPQPLITSTLAQNTGEHGFDPAAGNYTTSVSDAQVQTVGPALSVQRAYNSLDPRTGQAFGAGWSSLYDMRAQEVSDNTGITGVVIRYPTGEEVEFGRNSDGSFAPPQGRYATLTALSPGYKLVDKSGTTYTFNQSIGAGSYGIASIADFQGRTESFTYSGGLISTASSGPPGAGSGRALHLTWTTPAGATSPHVASVVTDPATPGDASTALTWTYSYTGDRLTSVCPPASATACTTYAYTGGSHFRTTVVDAGPRAYWRLADLPGTTTAADQMLVNESTLNSGYTSGSMPGGGDGPLGNGLSAANFDGVSNAVKLPDRLLTATTYLSIGLWFKTTSTSTGTLFSTGHSAVGTANPDGAAMPVLYVGSDGKLYGHFWNNTTPGISSPASVRDGKWHYAVLTAAGNTQSLYLDGAQVGSPLAGQLVNVDPVDIVGAGVYNNNGWPAAPSGNSWNYFKGQIAEVAYYTHPLSASVVQAQWSAAGRQANLLTGVTRPSGKADTTVVYHTADDNVAQLTDINGGTWGVGTPSVAGSSLGYAGAVMGSGPLDYWRLGETGASQAVNQVHGGTATYNAVTLGATGAFAAGDDTAASFNGTSSYAQLPGNLFPAGASSQELWFKTTGTNQILLSSQAAALGSTNCPCLPVMWITSDGKLRALSPSTSPNGPIAAKLLTGKCMDVDHGYTANGTKVQVWTCQNGNANQNWTLYPDGSVRNFGKCLDLSSYGTTNGTKVQLWDCTGASNQVWQPYNGGLRNPVSNRCLDDPSSSTTDGTQFQLYDCNGSNAQQWLQSLVTSAAVNDGQWHHAVLTTDGKAQSLYLDGALANSTTGSFTLTPGSPYAYLGAGYNGTTAAGLPANTTRYYNGSLDEAAFYTSALSATDVARHWAAYKSAFGVAPVETVQVNDPGASSVPVGAFPGTTYNASQAKTWSGPAARLVFQSDGNLVIYRADTGAATWSSSTAGHSSAVLAFQGDGNLVIYSDSTASTALWSSGTQGHSGNTATLQPNGTVTISDGTATRLWSAGTALTNAPHVLTYTFDPLNGNRPLSVTDALGSTTTYGYDTSGFLHTVTDPNGNVTTTGHDVRGNMVSQTTCQNQPAGVCSTSYYTYFPDDTSANPKPDQRNDLLMTVRDGRSSGPADPAYVTSYGYDAAGNRTSVTTPPVPGFPAGRTTKTTFTDGQTTQAADTGFAPAGLVATATTPGGATESVTYFHNGDPAVVTDPAGVTTRYTYDGLGRVLTKTVVSDSYPNGLTTSYTYDGQNRPVTITDPPVTDRVTGAVHTARTTNAYDADGDTLSTTVEDLTGGDAVRTVTNTFDAGDRVATATTAAGDTTSYTYDAYGNRVGETDPAGNTTVFGYDANRRLLSTTLKGFTGDPANPGAPRDLVENSRAYDPAGRLASVTDSMGWVTAYTYYDNGLTASITRRDPSTGASFVQQSNTYDAAGNLAGRVTNDGTTTTAYALDAAGRTASATLDPNGLNRTTSYAYSADDFVVSTRISDASGTVAATDATFDALGRTTSQTVHDDTAGHPAGWWKLADGQGAGYSPTYAVDASGNGAIATRSADGVTWNADSVTLDGSSGELDSATGHLNTAASYSVAAWVNLGATGTTWKTMVSQDATTASAFELNYSGADNKWAFSRITSDTTNRGSTTLTSTATVTLGTWYHVVGTYDAGTGAVAFYVNGASQGSATASSAPWAAGGPLVIGRSLYNGAAANHFQGQIANVQTYDRALSASDVASLYGYGRTGGALHSTLLTTRWTLDQRGLPTSSTDPAGNTTTYSYDEAGKKAVVVAPTVTAEVSGQQAVAVHPVTMTGYDTFGEPVETSDAGGNVTVVGYDAAGRVVSATLPSYTPPGSGTPITPVTGKSYDHLGQVATTTDPLGHVTSYTYDQLGDVATTTDPASGVSHYTYDTNGDRLSATDPTGAQTQATYDFLGRKLTSTDVVRQDGAAYTATNTYTLPGGYLTSSTSANGVTTSYGYDAAGENTSVTNGAGRTTTYRYDALGRRVAVVLPDGTSSTATFDEAGRQTGTADLDAGGATLRRSTASYDADGRTTSSTDPLGNTTTFSYDATGMLTRESQPVSTGTSIVTSFGYDAAGNRTRFTDGRGNSFMTTYNTWNRPESTIEPATPAHPAGADRTFTVTYDAAGRVAAQTSPGGVVVSNTYDNLGDLTQQTGTGAEAATAAHVFGYDAAGHLTSASAPGGTDTFGYDDRGLLRSTAGPSGTASFTYNGDGQLAIRTDAAGTSNYTYDTAGRVHTITDASTGATLSYGYNAVDLITSVNYGPGKANRSYTYNSLHQLTGDTLTDPTGAVEASISYGYDLNGNETAKTTTGLAGATSNTYTYDQAGRLTSWNNGTTTVAYGYDLSGNRTQVGARTYTYDARNELTSDGTSTYQYTPRGTLASVSGGATLTFDAFNRVVGEGGKTYTYDALDRVVTRDGFTFAYSGLGNDLATDGSSTYSRGPAGSLIGVAHAGTSVLAMADQHTDVVANFTAGGTGLTGSQSYDPFGNVIASANPLGNLGYQSGWTDPGTGKVNMAARWYDPAVGQFDSRDTVANPAAPNSVAANRFQYGNDNPLIGTDPTGHCDWWNVVCGVQQTVSHVVNTVKQVANTVKQVATSAWHTVTTVATNVWNTVSTAAQQFYHAATQFVSNAWNTAVHVATTVVNKVTDAYNNVKTWVSNTVTNTVNWVKQTATTVWHAAVYTYHHPVEALKFTAQATGNFLKAHAADIASFIASTAVFMGCEAALGVVTAGVGAVAGAVACGALSGAVGSAVTYGMTTPMSKWNLGDAAKAVGMGALTGAAGSLLGAAGGKLIATFGSKILGPVLDSVASRLGPAALEDAATTVAEDVTETAAKDATEAGLEDAANTATEPHGGGGEPPAGDAATSCANSFTSDTPVVMADDTAKSISQVKVGDKVEATDPITGVTASRPVNAVIMHSGKHTMVDITLADHSVIHSTDKHPIWDATVKAFVAADSLHVGDALLKSDGSAITITALRTYEDNLTAYNLEIDGIHTYFAGTTAILVHNSCLDPVKLRPQKISSKFDGNPWAKYQKLVTGRNYEDVYKYAGEEIHVDGAYGDTFVEAKWTGGNDAAFKSSPYHPDHDFYSAYKIGDQASKLMYLNKALGGDGVRYAVSNDAARVEFTNLFTRLFPDEMESGFLQVWHVPGTGM